MNKINYLVAMIPLALSVSVAAKTNNTTPVDDEIVAQQRSNLVTNTKNKGFGPQSPRNINAKTGSNAVIFSTAEVAFVIFPIVQTPVVSS